MSWLNKVTGLKTMVEKEKTNRENLKVQGVCIHGETNCVRCAAEDYEQASNSVEQSWQALDDIDLRRIIFALPPQIREILRRFPGETVVAGGFIRAIIADELVHDIDVFVKDEKKAKEVLDEVDLKGEKGELHYQAEAGGTPVQVIWRYKFDVPIDVPNDFDYTVCKAAVWFEEADKKNKTEAGYRGVCHERFYRDLARKELVYISERENEQSTGFIRLLKYTSYGYKVDPKSLAEIITKLCLNLDFDKGFDGIRQQLEDAYKANGSNSDWADLNKPYVKPKPKPKPRRVEYDYGGS